MSATFASDTWPADGLEQVDVCPYCNGSQRQLAYKDVEDWSFACAPGKWAFWDCLGCQSLYLNPRPTPATIGKAYANYYTHATEASASFLGRVKASLRNEYLSHKLDKNLEPRLHIPRIFRRIVVSMGREIVIPFGWDVLASRVKGRFMDVGCGAGRTVAQARQFGWDAIGLEIDPAAVRAARARGLTIVEGTYEKLADYENQLDCIMCSHVLEHVHNPQDFLVKLTRALTPGGILLVNMPNALSALRGYFGPDWRGLEAPRHVAIPSQPQLIRMLVALGFSVKSMPDGRLETAAESFRIKRRGSSLNSQDIDDARRLALRPMDQPDGNDLIRLVCELRHTARS